MEELSGYMIAFLLGMVFMLMVYLMLKLRRK